MQACTTHLPLKNTQFCVSNAFKAGPIKAAPRFQLRAASGHSDDASATTQDLECLATPLLASRRQLLAGVATTLLLSSPSPAYAGLERYVKKKKLDPLDTYVPLVLEAREVLADLGDTMVKDPSAARQLLRSGPFSGMRDNIRALGQYAAVPAAEGGAGLPEAEASQLVQGFFKALEDFDLLLYNAVREYKQQAKQAGASSGTGADNSSGEDSDAAAAEAVDPAVGLNKEEAQQKLQLAVQQLDKLIATVPAGVLAKSQQVLAKVTGKAVQAASVGDS